MVDWLLLRGLRLGSQQCRLMKGIGLCHFVLYGSESESETLVWQRGLDDIAEFGHTFKLVRTVISLFILHACLLLLLLGPIEWLRTSIALLLLLSSVSAPLC